MCRLWGSSCVERFEPLPVVVNTIERAWVNRHEGASNHVITTCDLLCGSTFWGTQVLTADCWTIQTSESIKSAGTIFWNLGLNTLLLFGAWSFQMFVAEWLYVHWSSWWLCHKRAGVRMLLDPLFLFYFFISLFDALGLLPWKWS